MAAKTHTKRGRMIQFANAQRPALQLRNGHQPAMMIYEGGQLRIYARPGVYKPYSIENIAAYRHTQIVGD